MNTKETLKRLHKKFPMMGLDELFEVLDCYVEQSFLTSFPNQDNKIWYSTQKTAGVNKLSDITCSTSENASNAICSLNTVCHGKIKC